MQKEDQNLQKEEKEIRKLWDKACFSLCSSHWETYATIWDKSAGIKLLHPAKQEWLTGWEQIGPYYKKFLDAGVKCKFFKKLPET